MQIESFFDYISKFYKENKDNIKYRDLKPENILFTSKDKENWDIKIIDFGLSRSFDSD